MEHKALKIVKYFLIGNEIVLQESHGLSGSAGFFIKKRCQHENTLSVPEAEAGIRGEK